MLTLYCYYYYYYYYYYYHCTMVGKQAVLCA